MIHKPLNNNRTIKTLKLTLNLMLAFWLMAQTAGAVNLWVGGTQVTSANMDLSNFEGVTGSVVLSQDPDTKAYTLQEDPLPRPHPLWGGRTRADMPDGLSHLKGGVPQRGGLLTKFLHPSLL